MELPLTDPIFQFTLLIAAALAMQLLFRTVHAPPLVGLLVVGMALGPGGAGILPREPVVDFLGAIGLVYLMFIAGLELDLEIVRTHRRQTLGFGGLAFVLSMAPAVALGRILGFEWRGAILLGALLSSHTLLAYPIVRRLGLLHRTGIVAAVGGTLVTDTAALLVLAVALPAAAGGGYEGVIASVLPLALLAALTLAALWGVPRLARFLFQRAPTTAAEDALFVLVVLLALAAAAELIGTHEILGAFLAGICLNRVLESRRELREHVEFVGHMLFIPFFFISTGMLLELEVLTREWRVWALAGALLAIVVFGKGVASWATGAHFGYPWRERLTMTGLTLPQAAATLAVTLTAQQAGLFDTGVVDAVLIVIFVTCLGGPLLTRFAAQQLRPPAGG